MSGVGRLLRPADLGSGPTNSHTWRSLLSGSLASSIALRPRDASLCGRTCPPTLVVGRKRSTATAVPGLNHGKAEQLQSRYGHRRGSANCRQFDLYRYHWADRQESRVTAWIFDHFREASAARLCCRWASCSLGPCKRPPPHLPTQRPYTRPAPRL